MMNRLTLALALCAGLSPLVRAAHDEHDAPYRGWLSWRGPHQNGHSDEKGLVEQLGLDNGSLLWTWEASGRGGPVVANGRVFVMAYRGERGALRELIACLDLRDGSLLWEREYNDFLSDHIYDRYSISAPAIDPQTGNVFYSTSSGMLSSVSRDGVLLWEHSLTEEYGRLTFPNGRIGAPIVVDDFVIFHIVNSAWGPLGPALSRIFAFDKTTGQVAWISSPGKPPKDSPYSHPVVGMANGRRVLYCGTGCGHIVCLDLGTGAPLWRFEFSQGGIGAAVIVDGERLYAVHGKENVDSSTMGRINCLKLGAEPAAGQPGPLELTAKEWELWRNDDLVSFTSSPLLIDGNLYCTAENGDLFCLNATDGKERWRKKLGTDQVHASPMYADGRMWIPMNDGGFHIVKPSATGLEVLSSVQLDGNLLGAPAICDGRVLVFSTKRLYCFGKPALKDDGKPRAALAALRVAPMDALLRPGEQMFLRVDGLDAKSQVVDTEPRSLAFQIPPTLGVVAQGHMLRVKPDAKPGAGMVAVSSGAAKGSIRVRIVPNAPFAEDFNAYELKETHAIDKVPFAQAPSYWLAAARKWEVRELKGEKVLAKTLDNQLFQRNQCFFGFPELSNHIVEADVLTEGTRRMRSAVGVINQRYVIWLKGNHGTIEVTSNNERIQESKPFDFQPDVWYRLKTRVDVGADGVGMIRAKAWPRDQAEPAEWTFEVRHEGAHTHGSPGLYAMTPGNRYRVYVDNIRVYPHD
jgi:outer membrane protein assembly factor BamB